MFGFCLFVCLLTDNRGLSEASKKIEKGERTFSGKGRCRHICNGDFCLQQPTVGAAVALSLPLLLF